MEVVQIIPRHDTLGLYKLMRFLQDDGWTYDGKALRKNKFTLILETYADRDAETGEISKYVVEELMKPSLANLRAERPIKAADIYAKHAEKSVATKQEARLVSKSDAERPTPMSEDEVAEWAQTK